MNSRQGHLPGHLWTKKNKHFRDQTINLRCLRLFQALELCPEMWFHLEPQLSYCRAWVFNKSSRVSHYTGPHSLWLSIGLQVRDLYLILQCSTVLSVRHNISHFGGEGTYLIPEQLWGKQTLHNIKYFNQDAVCPSNMLNMSLVKNLSFKYGYK